MISGSKFDLRSDLDLSPDLEPELATLTPFSQRVIAEIRAIPAGQVRSYGEIARLAGSPRAARQVVRVLSSCSAKYDLPWHRVVNKAGIISFTDEHKKLEQIARLRGEGVEVSEAGKVLSGYGAAQAHAQT